MFRSIAGALPRRATLWTTTLVTGSAGGGGFYYYHYRNNHAPTTTFESARTTLGVRRQAQFWRGVLPVVVDYYWNFGSYSPYVKYLKWTSSRKEASPNTKPENEKSSDKTELVLAKTSQNASSFGTEEEEQTDTDWYLADKKRRMQELHERHAPELLRVLLNLKGLYIKLGQVLSVTALPIPEPYRIRFRTLQSNVPGHEDWDTIERVLQHEFATSDLSTIFAWIEPVPQGAASIGQAHRAMLKHDNDKVGEEVIIKIQYPDAAWQVPADIQCVGDFMKLCVLAGIVDESASRISFDEFARQFTSELDYDAERRNLKETYQSTLLSDAPYRRRGVVVPHVYDELSTSKVITMAYLRGPKLEEEARRQLAALGIDMSRGIGQIVREAAARDDALDGVEEEAELMMSQRQQKQQPSWKVRWGSRVGQWIGVDRAFGTLRVVQRVRLWTTALSASAVRLLPMMPTQWKNWSEEQLTAYQQAQSLDVTKRWIDALFDVHGYQIFQQGLFNADCHPGNILVLEDENGQMTTQLGLIDFGQCKRLTPTERAHVAELLLSVANQEPDEKVATAFRRMHVQTKNDSTEFLAEMARLMFGRFETHHLDHAYHRRLHEMDRVTYFPKELSMVYRTSLLLRGLAVSLQINPSVSEQWRSHAQAAVDQHGGALVQEAQRPRTTQIRSSFAGDQEPLVVGKVAATG